MSNRLFWNFRCRKCGQIISLQTNDDLMNNDVCLLSGNDHKNCLQKTMSNEFIMMDLISVSDEPLPSAVDVI